MKNNNKNQWVKLGTVGAQWLIQLSIHLTENFENVADDKINRFLAKQCKLKFRCFYWFRI